jgi:hypothetical protein
MLPQGFNQVIPGVVVNAINPEKITSKRGNVYTQARGTAPTGETVMFICREELVVGDKVTLSLLPTDNGFTTIGEKTVW